MIANGECGSFNALVLECLEDISEELRREMQINSPDHKVSKEIQELSAKMQHYEELSSSTKMLWQLEFERVKSQFFVSELPDLAFVYQIEPPILTLSQPNSLYAGMSEAIIDPFHNAQFEEYIQNGEQLIDIITENVHQTTMQQPFPATFYLILLFFLELLHLEKPDNIGDWAFPDNLIDSVSLPVPLYHFWELIKRITVTVQSTIDN